MLKTGNRINETFIMLLHTLKFSHYQQLSKPFLHTFQCYLKFLD